MSPHVLILIGLDLGYNICSPMKKFEGNKNLLSHIFTLVFAICNLTLNCA
ncbi:hypothetical protein SLEP1_g6872 [Rubroshorea leprosula]|uniref:Uncharacterized protein n=1 Tax=Rubroshorea leprosula TaxID=152421 RepID=A0AAV5I2Y5_9ROSI|nr:hypothetical protein SLEP1_g6872 [Rubroshorea leprosula]